MRVALALLCIGAVSFLLRVLVALVKEGIHVPPRTAKLYFARFKPSRQGELVVMRPEIQRREFPPRAAS